MESKGESSDSLEQMHLRSETDAKVRFAKIANLLADRLKKDGDPRLATQIKSVLNLSKSIRRWPLALRHGRERI